MSSNARIPSPIDEMAAPEQLTARVVAPGDRPRLHGYDVHEDLAAHFRFSEVVLLALTGEAPSEQAGRVFDALLTFACPIGVGEAPSHAASLARLCAAKPSSVAAVAAIGLAEQARYQLDEREELLAWLDDARSGPCPESLDDPATRRLHERLVACGASVPPADGGLGLTSALVAALHDLGLRERWQLEAFHAVARWPVAIAEAMSNAAGDVRSYPIRLPAFEISRDGR